MISSDWALSCKNLGLTTKSEIRQIFLTKIDLIKAIKQWHIKNSLQYKIQQSTITYLQL
jgi:hypothetical protein